MTMFFFERLKYCIWLCATEQNWVCDISSTVNLVEWASV